MWRVVRVEPGDPLLIDRTGTFRLATTDPAGKVIRIRSDLKPPLLDRVTLHEIAHAITISWGLLDGTHYDVLRGDLTGVEERMAQLVENHALEALEAARMALGRKVCVRGGCFD